MKVAIIGTGLAGLACAHEFERLGVKPDIFEKNEKIGQQFNHVTALLQIVDRPIKDLLEYMRKNFFLDLKEIGKIKEFVMNAPNATSTIKGSFLGYLTLRGQDKNSLDYQIASKLSCNIYLNTKADVLKLAKEYDYVVVASGTPDIPRSLGVWTTLVDACAHGAVVSGDFKPDSIIMWLDTSYATTGFAYLCPFNNKEAVIVLCPVHIGQAQIKPLWQRFWRQNNFTYTIEDEFEIMISSGFVFPLSVDNIYFIGNAGGFLESFLGFGQFYGISSGVIAARSIMQNKNYGEEVKTVLEEVMHLLELRRAIDGFDNHDFDKLVKFLGLPVVNKLIYNTNIDIIKYSSSIIEAFSKAAVMKLTKSSFILKW